MEVKWLADKERISVEEVLAELKHAGIGSMPGTAAEILVDEVRQRICPTKLSTAEWVHVIRAAHRLGIPTTATMMFGHIETWAHRIEHLQVILDIQRETGGFTEFVLLPFVPWNTNLGHQFAIKPISLEEILKVTAYARLFFGKDLVNIQGSWVKMGVSGMQKALSCGANDFGGTLMEENISRSAGSPYGERLTREEIEAAIRAVGRTPVERDTLYHRRPVR
jgi:FO synthase subunit 2